MYKFLITFSIVRSKKYLIKRLGFEYIYLALFFLLFYFGKFFSILGINIFWANIKAGF